VIGQEEFYMLLEPFDLENIRQVASWSLHEWTPLLISR
jgi:hypothetical protein